MTYKSVIILSINDIDAGMINSDDLQSMLDTPGNKTKLIIERLVQPQWKNKIYPRTQC